MMRNSKIHARGIELEQRDWKSMCSLLRAWMLLDLQIAERDLNPEDMIKQEKDLVPKTIEKLQYTFEGAYRFSNGPSRSTSPWQLFWNMSPV